VTGSTDILIKVRTESMAHLSDIITKQLRKIKGVDKTQTMMVMEEM